MNDQELEIEVLNLAYSLNDSEGLEHNTIQYISQTLQLDFGYVQEILTHELFDID